MKNLESVINQHRKRIELHVIRTTSSGSPQDKSGNSHWRGKKLVDCWGWSHVRHLNNWEETLKFMPEYFEYGPLNTQLYLNEFPELTKMFEDWLNDYHDYLISIEDTTEKEIWKHISK